MQHHPTATYAHTKIHKSIKCEELIRDKHEKIASTATFLIQEKLAKDEENVMRYVGGYIVSKLSRKVRNIPNIGAIISNMRHDSDKETSLSYTKEWMGLRIKVDCV